MLLLLFVVYESKHGAKIERDEMIVGVFLQLFVNVLIRVLSFISQGIGQVCLRLLRKQEILEYLWCLIQILQLWLNFEVNSSHCLFQCSSALDCAPAGRRLSVRDSRNGAH